MMCLLEVRFEVAISYVRLEGRPLHEMPTLRYGCDINIHINDIIYLFMYFGLVFARVSADYESPNLEKCIRVFIYMPYFMWITVKIRFRNILDSKEYLS